MEIEEAIEMIKSLQKIYKRIASESSFFKKRYEALSLALQVLKKPKVAEGEIADIITEEIILKLPKGKYPIISGIEAKVAHKIAQKASEIFLDNPTEKE